MSLFNSAWSSIKNLRKYSIGLAPTFIFPNGISPKTNDAALVAKYRGWTYIAASVNGAAVASTPLRLYATVGPDERMPESRDGGGCGEPLSEKQIDTMCKQNSKRLSPRLRRADKIVEIFDHPFLDMMSNPNPWATQFEFMEGTSVFSDITGDSYWQVTMDKRLGIPKQLYLLPSQFVRIVPDKTKFIKGYLFGRNAQNRVAFKPNEILHIKQFNPQDAYYGLGCLEAAIVAVNNYDSMDNYEGALTANMGVPGQVVSYKGRLKAEDIPKLEAEWNRTMKGVRNAGRTKVASSEYEIKETGFSPREMGFLQGRKWTRNEIANSFGVPISMLETENVNKANAQAGNEQYARRSITPRLRRIEDKINDQLIPMYDEPRLFAAFDNPVPEDEEFNAKKAENTFKANLITQNEGRRLIGEGAVEGGDRLSAEIIAMSNNQLQAPSTETDDEQE